MASRAARILVFGLLLAFGSSAQADYSLVWSDEFDGTSLDLGKWTMDVGDGCPDLCGWGNEELEYYRPENVAVSGGNLVLTAKAESYGGRQFTSGKVHTRDKHSFLYGRIEARAKIPTGGGMWPAFWMMPQDDAYGGWAASGEIDIMESANATTEVSGTLHFGGSWPDNVQTGGSYDLGGENFADAFHVYAVEWEPEEIRWYVDGLLFSTKVSSQWWSDGAPGNPLAPFDQEFYLILNAAVGGWFTGCTSPSCVSADLPQDFLIDYVRVYQDTGNQAPTVTLTYPTEADNPPAGDISILADAADADGAVDRVEFYAGTTYLGEDAIPPYSFHWADVAEGCYAVVARAFDDAGAEGVDAVDLTVGAGCGQEPFAGGAFLLPTKIEAEDFDLGGEGVAYHDTDVGNNGNQYRPDEDVDIEVCYDEGGGYNLGWVREGEWLEYTIDVPVGGEYPIQVRVSSLSQGGTFHLEIDGIDRSGDVTVPVTGGWQSWTTAYTTAMLPAGVHVLRFVPTAEGFNVNSIDILAATAAPEAEADRFVLHPCQPNPFNPSTTLRFELPAAATVSLDVFDVSGRRVRRLIAEETLAAGAHAVVWDGRDEAGRGAAAGIYLARLGADGRSETRRLALVK